MRNLSGWKLGLKKALAAQWPEEVDCLGVDQLCDIELGLALLQAISPRSPAQALWVFLTGYPFPAVEVEGWSEEQHRALGIARHLIPYYRSEYPWLQALNAYRKTPEILRGYALDEAGSIARRPVSVAANRFEFFERTLSQTPAYQKGSLQWAEAGSYRFLNRQWHTSVNLPGEVAQQPPTGHALNGALIKPPVTADWAELIATARWMDEQTQRRGIEAAYYAQRLEKVQFELVSPDGQTLQPASRLTIDRLLHVIGMVSSGKSTLMDILAVWAARQGLHITLVVGDVVSALNRAQFFCALGLAAAPVLGASNRARHLNRLHRLVSADQTTSPLFPQHTGFRWLSTLCPLDGLRDDPQPLQIGKEPCLYLQASATDDDEPGKSKTYACPMYGACPSHRAQRDLVDARIWVATPASLVYTRVALQLNVERLRFLELVYRRSDLVIVDEADQVQVQLDTMFSPSQTLMGRSAEAWLSQIQQTVTRQLNLEGRGQLRHKEVEAWLLAHDVGQSATSRIYGWLMRNSRLRRWVETDDYFTGLTLFNNLAHELTKLVGTNAPSHTSATDWVREFDEYLKDPLGEDRPHPLAALAHQFLAVTQEERRTSAAAEWLRRKGLAISDSDEIEFIAQKLELAVLVTVMQDRLNFILRRWREVEAILRLEGGGALLFQSPPDDYEAVTPAAPMGNVLAFQYLRPNDQSTDTPGELRFFRCMGVGRWILLNLPRLFAADGVAGPNTLLLSGTSWAGTSPVFHVQVPVGGILRAPEHEVEAIHRSQFKYDPIYDEQTGRPVRVSGLKGAERANALKAMAHELARPSRAGGDSLLEKERHRLPENRQRILMLVGSYDEAKRLYLYLTRELREDWQGQVSYLVSDENQFDTEWRTEKADALQRGLVHQFASRNAWLLIAPLLAVERGHNILNEQQQAALGAVYFLVRPHPRPDDIHFAIHSINQWAVEHHAQHAWLRQVAPDMTWNAIGAAFRQAGFRRWRQLLGLSMKYSELEADDREAVTWGQMVSIWQVIGRLVRGGSPARVVFCDAAFAPALTEADDRTPAMPSLLLEMRRILRPYFNGSGGSDSALVQTLYGPLYTALVQMQGVPPDVEL